MYVFVQRIQDEEAREVEEAGLADKDAFAELKALAGEGGTMAHGEGLPAPPKPVNDPKVQFASSNQVSMTNTPTRCLEQHLDMLICHCHCMAAIIAIAALLTCSACASSMFYLKFA